MSAGKNCVHESTKRRLKYDDENRTSPSTSQEPCNKRVRYSENEYCDWTSDEISEYLRDGGIEEETISKIEVGLLNGRTLIQLDKTTLESLGVIDAEEQEAVLRRVNKLFNRQSEPEPASQRPDYKVFNDSIHGHIQMHPLLVAIMDTPQFQRLRWIKQLGIAYLVYPGGSHNRFEHSLGVAHLAGEFGRSLQKNQPELNITDVDLLCLEMAGLCHDLGHGPFSHIFDNKFLPRVAPDDKKWKHEDASIKMFDHMIEQNKLNKKLTEYNIKERDILFVKELIRGPLKDNRYCARPVEKHFLYEIVANKRNAIDVDKWDYFARDCHHLGIKSTFDYKRFIFFARVIRPQGTDDQGNPLPPMICCRDKEAKTLYDMFQSRANLHRTAYQHKTNQNLENMIVQAFIKANDYLKFKGKNGKLLKLSECIHDMEAYSRLTDNIFTDILFSTDPNLKESRQILENMQRRKLFKYIGETRPERRDGSGDESNKVSEAVSHRDDIAAICEAIEKKKNSTGRSRFDWKNELIGQLVYFDYGMGGDNPIDKMLFYSKHNPNEAFQLKKNEISMMLPQIFAECRFRLYCKSDDPAVHEIAAEGMREWCVRMNHVPPKLMGIEFTPRKTVQAPVYKLSPVVDRGKESLAMN